MGAQDGEERECQTRKKRIDTRLEALGWKVVRFDPERPQPPRAPAAVCEYPTDDGPADYALCADGHIVGVVEAKKLSLGPQKALKRVLTLLENGGKGGTIER